MNKKTIIKISLDAVMAIILVLMYNSHAITLGFHELAGLILAGMFIIHCALNYKWILSVSKRILSAKLAVRVRFGYIINVLLLVSFCLVIISGIKTSQILFPPEIEVKGTIWRGIHHSAAALALALTGIHLGMHWQFIMSKLGKVIVMPRNISAILCAVLIATSAIYGVYTMVSGSFFMWLAEPFTSTYTTDNAGAQQKSGEGKDSGRVDNVNGDDRRGEHSGGDKKQEVGSIPGVAVTFVEHLSIVVLFAALVYYIDKLILIKTAIKKVKEMSW